MLMATRTRTPSGQYSRANETKEFAPTQVKRLRDAAMRQMADPEWGTELGRLFLQEAITSQMYAAGKKWAEMVKKYHYAIGVFPSRSATLERGIKSSPPDPDSDAGRKIAKREADNAERFFETHAVLVFQGALVESVVRRLCEHDEAPVGMDGLAKARRGLLAIASHLDLTKRGKSRSAERSR